jgi:alpha-mannosidase
MGPLSARLRVHKRLLNCLVEQTISVWSEQPRVDIETRIYWWGKRNQHVRQVIAPATKAQISYGSPFYGVGWLEMVPGAAPGQSDEVTPEDYPNYREVQGWLHVQGERAGLLVCTMHPGFFHDDVTLEAVLLRTPPSCGDKRFYWENSGEQHFSFSYVLTERDWRQSNVQATATKVWRPPLAKLISAQGNGVLPSKLSLLQVDCGTALCSSLYPGDDAREMILRLYDTVGADSEIILTGSLCKGEALATDFMHRERNTLPGEAGRWRIALPAWAIQTVKLKYDEP